jgi:hypothetical protein
VRAYHVGGLGQHVLDGRGGVRERELVERLLGRCLLTERALAALLRVDELRRELVHLLLQPRLRSIDVRVRWEVGDGSAIIHRHARHTSQMLRARDAQTG